MSNTMSREEAKAEIQNGADYLAHIGYYDKGCRMSDALAVLAPEPVEIPWLPMTPDAVFEDGELVLCREKLFGDYLSLMYDKGSNGFDHSAARCGSSYCVRDDGYYDRTEITHYARITEPNK